jgi:N-acetylglucosaminyl-diphospho-decaprenol L-rhamnosyltransferase
VRLLHTGTELSPGPAHPAVALDQVTVIVVTFNSAHCLPALKTSLDKFAHIIVVDNGSDDGGADLTPQYLPQARVLALPSNLGFGAANNRALAQVTTPFALLLNPDCEITSDAVWGLLDTANAFPEAAVVAPQLLQPDGQADINYRWPHLLWKSKGPGVQGGPACVGFVCGAAMLFRCCAFAQSGYFDEQFFLYYEDDDLCLRLFQAHLPMIIDPRYTALHKSRGSVRGKSPWRSEYLRGYHHAQSKLIFARKHQSTAIAITQRRQLLVETTFALVLRVLVPSPRLIARMVGRWRGLFDWSAR